MAKFKLKGGIELTVSKTYSTGITANCGMCELSCIAVSARRIENSFKSTMLLRGELEQLINQNWSLVYEEIVKGLTRGLVVLSDVMLLEGAALDKPHGCQWRTADFIRELIRRQIGHVTLSPLVRNGTYNPGSHDIQACLWVMPSYTSTIVAPASIHAGKEVEGPVYKEKHADAYNEFLYKLPAPSVHKEEWEIQPS